MWEAAPAFLVSKQQRAAPLRDAALLREIPPRGARPARGGRGYAKFADTDSACPQYDAGLRENYFTVTTNCSAVRILWNLPSLLPVPPVIPV